MFYAFFLIFCPLFSSAMRWPRCTNEWKCRWDLIRCWCHCHFHLPAGIHAGRVFLNYLWRWRCLEQPCPIMSRYAPGLCLYCICFLCASCCARSFMFPSRVLVCRTMFSMCLCCVTVCMQWWPALTLAFLPTAIGISSATTSVLQWLTPVTWGTLCKVPCSETVCSLPMAPPPHGVAHFLFARVSACYRGPLS